MKFRKAGSLPWEVSALGFGCMRLPTRGLLHRIDERKATEILRFGIDRGVNYVDTAWFYHFGQSEEVLGRALRDGYREKVHLATKLPMVLLRDEDGFEKYLHQQLKKLATDYLDVYLFHMLNAGQFEKLQRFKLIEKMERARTEGKIRHIGFSFHDTLPVFKKIVDYYPWDMTLMQYNYMDTGIQATTDGLEYAHSKGIACFIMEPLKCGQLANPPEEAMRVIHGAPVKRTPVDWALQFLWNRPEVACVLSGMGSRRMVEENCDSADASGVATLSPEENRVIQELAAIYRKKILVPCTACGYCMPCPAGVDIPQNFAYLNYKSLGAGGALKSRLVQMMITRNYRHLAKSKDRIQEGKPNGRASVCTKCGACVPKCPQKIAIPQELERVKAVFEQGKSVKTI
jgi:predicted aldo/keto reductase-like oxidoreductase